MTDGPVLLSGLLAPERGLAVGFPTEGPPPNYCTVIQGDSRGRVTLNEVMNDPGSERMLKKGIEHIDHHRGEHWGEPPNP